MSSAEKNLCAVIFGGTGFIGTFFAHHLLAQGIVSKVHLLDLEPMEAKASVFRRQMVQNEPRMQVVICDVRQPIEWQPDEPVALIANFAAIHREPGHEDWEYYQTNLLGAEHVCAWAQRVGCTRMIFTSSISPYGISIEPKDENSLPVPTTAYGASKLAAEHIHRTWQAGDPQRRLIIVRPGVVFGPGEGGNVSRLIRAVLRGYFFFMGNRDTRKAGVYVEELCLALLWAMRQQEAQGQGVVLFNMSMNPGPSIEEYVQTISLIAGKQRHFWRVPYPLLLRAAYLIDALARPLGIRHPFSPVRIRKLVRPNDIRPTYLLERGYTFTYDLKSALQDWRDRCPEEWT